MKTMTPAQADRLIGHYRELYRLAKEYIDRVAAYQSDRAAPIAAEARALKRKLEDMKG